MSVHLGVKRQGPGSVLFDLCSRVINTEAMRPALIPIESQEGGELKYYSSRLSK